MSGQDIAQRYVVESFEAPICDGGGTKYAVIDTEAEHAPGIVHWGPFYKETRDEQLARRWADELNEQDAATQANIAEAAAIAHYDEPAVPLEEALAPYAERTAARKLAREQAAGLRALADMLENNPELAQHFRYTDIERIAIPIAYQDGDKAAMLAQFARAGLGAGAKVDKYISGEHFGVNLSWGPVAIHVYAQREQVCERVVVGTETVTTTVPDPVKLAEVPLVEVTEQVEQIEWICRPLLAAESGGGA